MTKQEILAFINQNMACTLATSGADQLQLRWRWIYLINQQRSSFIASFVYDAIKVFE